MYDRYLSKTTATFRLLSCELEIWHAKTDSNQFLAMAGDKESKITHRHTHPHTHKHTIVYYCISIGNLFVIALALAFILI